MVVPAGTVVRLVVPSSPTTRPEASTGPALRLTSSTQSEPPEASLDSISLIRTGLVQSLAAPEVAPAVSRNSPVPSGQRPYVVAAGVA